MNENKYLKGNLAGITALLLWASTIAFSRSVTETLGTLNAAFFINLFSGLFGFLLLFLRFGKGLGEKIKNFDYRYLLKVGIFFIFYILFFNISVGIAETRGDVLIVGIINYLWPGLVFLFSVPILKAKVKYHFLLPGLIIAFSGTALAIASGNGLGLEQIGSLNSEKIFVYTLALIAAFLWAIYSNLAKKIIVNDDLLAVPLFFIIIGVIFFLILLVKGESPNISISGWKSYLELAYLIIFPSALAYSLWDISLKKGNLRLINTVSFSVPLISTAFNLFFLRVRISGNFWLACLLVIGGALLCWKSTVKNN